MKTMRFVLLTVAVAALAMVATNVACNEARRQEQRAAERDPVVERSIEPDRAEASVGIVPPTGSKREIEPPEGDQGAPAPCLGTRAQRPETPPDPGPPPLPPVRRVARRGVSTLEDWRVADDRAAGAPVAASGD